MQNANENNSYTCPMHPEIRQSTPGNCPICGMTLEPIIPVVDQQEEKELTQAAKYERNQRGLTLLVPNHFNEKLSFLYIFR